MRKNLLLLTLCFITGLFTKAQTLTFKPGPQDGTDASIRTTDGCTPNGHLTPMEEENYGDQKELNYFDWTFNSLGCPHGTSRFLIRFSDLDNLPSEITITNATLKFYGVSNSSTIYEGNSQFPGSPFSSNQAYVRKVTEDWQENTVTWSNQPSTSTVHQVTVPASDSQWNWNVSIDVTQLVQDILNDGNNQGFMLKLKNEGIYRSVLFASSDHPESDLWPELVITYTTDSPPDLNNVQATACEEGNGKGIFDLTENEEDIISGNHYTFTYFADSTDTDGLQNEITDPDNFVASNNTVVYVKVEDQNSNWSGIAQINLKVNPTPQINIPDTISVCSLENLVLDATPTNMDVDEVIFEWYYNGVVISENGPMVNVSDYGYGIYTVFVITEGHECSSQRDITVKEIEGPAVNLKSDKPLDREFNYCKGDADDLDDYKVILTAVLRNISKEDAEVSWYKNGEKINGVTGLTYSVEFECDNGQNGCEYQNSYTIEINSADCTASDSVMTNVRFEPYQHPCKITQGLSPDNHDGYNDKLDLAWLSDRSGISRFEVFNRYGTKVYTKDDYRDSWHGQSHNGRDLPTGTYYYIIKIKNKDPVFGYFYKGWIYLEHSKG